MRSAAILVLATACGGGSSGVDLTGMYRVDVAVGSSPCGADNPIANQAPFLKFKKDDFLGQTFFAYDGCMDEAGLDCGSTGGLFSGFFEPISNGWKGVVTASSGTPASCALTYFEQTAILKDLKLVIDGSSFSETVAVSACEPEEAEKRNTDMPCEEHERIEATKLP
jgi:hypothetical protein